MLIAPRIEADFETCGGKARIAGTRIRVLDVLELMASGALTDEILADYPTLGREDIFAALSYAAIQVSRPVVFSLGDETAVAHAAE